MNQIPNKKLALLFWVLVFIELAAVIFSVKWLHQVAKPMLMPALAILIYTHKTIHSGKTMVLTGLFFSWLGDIFLLIESGNSLFFILGLASFLITHVCYIRYFLSIRAAAPSQLKKYPIYTLLILCYGAGLVWLLFPFLGGLKIPVMLYAAVICSMLLGSIHVFFKVNAPSNWNFVAGALLFVLSDSLLAFNKFYQPLPFAGTWIMLTYSAAQYFIVRGFITMKNIETSGFILGR
jgi:uncharacterized membrane protein YhhN